MGAFDKGAPDNVMVLDNTTTVMRRAFLDTMWYVHYHVAPESYFKVGQVYLSNI